MSSSVPKHHKEVAAFLLERRGGEGSVIAYRDNSGKRPIAIGSYGSTKALLHSTIGACDLKLKLPAGHYEFAAFGRHEWLPNALASSIYWLRDREVSEWPLVCEDVVRHNVKSPYRHMAYAPSTRSLELSNGKCVQWLLGVPITDTEISITLDEALERITWAYPGWLLLDSD
jgi:hypothetical protein